MSCWFSWTFWSPAEGCQPCRVGVEFLVLEVSRRPFLLFFMLGKKISGTRFRQKCPPNSPGHQLYIHSHIHTFNAGQVRVWRTPAATHTQAQPFSEMWGPDLDGWTRCRQTFGTRGQNQCATGPSFGIKATKCCTQMHDGGQRQTGPKSAPGPGFTRSVPFGSGQGSICRSLEKLQPDPRRDPVWAVPGLSLQKRHSHGGLLGPWRHTPQQVPSSVASPASRSGGEACDCSHNTVRQQRKPHHNCAETNM